MAVGWAGLVRYDWVISFAEDYARSVAEQLRPEVWSRVVTTVWIRWWGRIVQRHGGEVEGTELCRRVAPPRPFVGKKSVQRE